MAKKQQAPTPVAKKKADLKVAQGAVKKETAKNVSLRTVIKAVSRTLGRLLASRGDLTTAHRRRHRRRPNPYRTLGPASQAQQLLRQ